MDSDSDHRLLTPREVTEILGVSRATLARWRSDGKGPPFLKLGDEPNSPVRYRASDVRDFLDGSAVEWVRE